MNVRYFTFTKPASTTGSQTVTAPGEPVYPKALILWTTRQTSLALTDGGDFGIGIADSYGHQVTRSVAWPDADVAPPATGQIESDDYIVRMGTANDGAAPTINLEATFTAFTSSGFTLNWVTNDAPETIFHALLLGGEIDAYLRLVRPSTSSADTVISDIPFQPDCFLVLGGAAGEDGGGPSNDSSTEFGSLHGLSWSDGSSIQSCAWTLTRPGLVGGIDCYRGMLTNACASIRVANLALAGVMGSYTVNTITANGFTLSRIDGSREHNQHILCLQNVQMAAGSFTAPTSNGTQTLTVGFPADCLIAESNNANSTNTSGAHLCLGAWDSTDQGYAVIAGEDSSDPSVFARAQGEDVLLRLITPAATGSSSTTNSQCAVSASDATTVTLNFTTTSAGTRQVIWVALAGTEDEPIDNPDPPFVDGEVSIPLTHITVTLKDGTAQPFAEVDLNDRDGYFHGFRA